MAKLSRGSRITSARPISTACKTNWRQRRRGYSGFFSDISGHQRRVNLYGRFRALLSTITWTPPTASFRTSSLRSKISRTLSTSWRQTWRRRRRSLAPRRARGCTTCLLPPWLETWRWPGTTAPTTGPSFKTRMCANLMVRDRWNYLFYEV